MASIIAGICLKPEAVGGKVHKAFAAVDTFACITGIVLLALAMINNIGPLASASMSLKTGVAALSILGLFMLAHKNIAPAQKVHEAQGELASRRSR